MRLHRLVGPTFVSVFFQEAVDFMKIKLTPVCLQSGEAFEVTVREERHNDGSLAADCGRRLGAPRHVTISTPLAIAAACVGFQRANTRPRTPFRLAAFPNPC
jgi:hypothetical protein